MVGPSEQAPRPPQDKPEGILERWGGRDVLLVVAVCVGLVLCSAAGLGMFLILDALAQSCGTWFSDVW